MKQNIQTLSTGGRRNESNVGRLVKVTLISLYIIFSTCLENPISTDFSSMSGLFLTNKIFFSLLKWSLK